jgi:hypothetical protein
MWEFLANDSYAQAQSLNDIVAERGANAHAIDQIV